MPDDKQQTQQYSLKDDPAFKQVITLLSAFGTNLKEIQKENQELKGRLAEVSRRGSPEELPSDRKPKEINPEEINNMSQADLVKHILETVNSSVRQIADRADKSVSSLADRLSETAARGELKEFAKEHPDVFEFGSELKDIIDATPGISISRAYALARAENPEKAKQIDEKYNPPKTPEKKPFGGLTPTSGMTPGGDEKMTAEEASNKAWEDTISSFPNLADHST